MKERLAAMRRIVRVQEQMRRLADWRLLETEGTLRALEVARSDLEAFVQQPETLGGLGVAALKQVQRLAERQKILDAEKEQRVAAKTEVERRLKGAETMVEDLARAEREASERRDLDAIIEADMARRSRPNGAQ